MKNKNIIISVSLGILLLLGGLLLFIFNKDDEKYSTIYLEINPSIEIKVDKDENVISVNALNDDAKEIVSDNLKDKKLDDVFYTILDKLIDKGYTRDNNITMLLHVNGDLESEEIINKIKNDFSLKNINADVIVVDQVSNEDIEYAKEHNISSYKAAFLNSLKKSNENVNIDELIDKSVNELNEIKNTGNYCDDGYLLEGDKCFKEIDRIEAHTGNVCPSGRFMEYNGKCYEETPYIESTNLICRDDFTLVNGMCIKNDILPAEGICSNGEYDSEKDICHEQVYIGDAYEYCRDPGRTLYDHKCLATKPTINGGCLNGDMLYNGKCVNTRNDYYASEWMCPNGQTNSRDNGELLFPDNKCYEQKEVKPSSYKCEENFVYDGQKCVKENKREPEKERICPDGFTKVPYDRCINLNDPKDYETGLVCDMENARVEGNVCVVYEVVEAKKW